MPPGASVRPGRATVRGLLGQVSGLRRGGTGAGWRRAAAPGGPRPEFTEADGPLPPRLPQVLAETEHVVAISKPAGMPFHHAGGDPGVPQVLRRMQREGLLDWKGELLSVHRLDRVTSGGWNKCRRRAGRGADARGAAASGVMLFAKSQAAATDISCRFSQREVTKYYSALSRRKPSKKQGRVVGDMKKTRRGGWKLLREQTNPAVTSFVSRGVESSLPGLRFFLLRPRTGRTHQLRVAMKALGAAVYGDPLYCDGLEEAEEDRCYLHASAVRLTVLGEPFQVVCRPDQDGQGPLWPATEGWPFPAGLEDNHGPWFPELPTLRCDRFGGSGERV